MEVKCKGCEGNIRHIETNEIDQVLSIIGITHSLPMCEWFEITEIFDIAAYLNVAEYKIKHNLEIKQ